MRKRFTAVILALLICVSALPVGSLAAEEVEPLNSAIPAEGLTINSDADTSDIVYTAGSGTISWDAASKTLTLDNATIENTDTFGITFSGSEAAHYTLNLVGSNAVTSKSQGIRLLNDNSSLTIRGEGTLDIAVYGYGHPIYGIGTSDDTTDYDGDIIFAGGTTNIRVTLQQGMYTYGVYNKKGKILVQDGTLTMDGVNGDNFYGLYSCANIIHITDGIVDIAASGSVIQGAAVRIDGGTVTAKNTKSDIYAASAISASDGGYPSYAEEDIWEEGGLHHGIIITGGTITAQGLNGLYSKDIICLYGGSVTMTSTGPYKPEFSQHGDLAYAWESTSCTEHKGFSHIYIPSGSTITPSAAVVIEESDHTYLRLDGQTPKTVTVTGADTTPRKVTVAGTGTGGTAEGVYGYFLPGMTVSIQAGTSSQDFKGWTASAALTFADASAAETTFVMPDSDITVTANWGSSTPDPDPNPDPDPSVPKYRLNVEFTGDYSEGESSGAGAYPAGAEVTIYAGTREGYAFRSWATSESSQIEFKDGYNGMTKNPTVIIMPAQVDTVSIDWLSLATYHVIVDTAGGVLPEGESSGDGYYAQWDVGTINAGTKAGYIFAGWSYNNTEVAVYDPDKPQSGFTMMKGYPVKITATWKEDPDNPPPSNDPHTITLLHRSGGSVDLGTVVWPTTYRAGETVTLNLTMDEYTFNRCTVSGNKITTNPVTFTMPDSDLRITIIWDPVLYHLTVNNLGILGTGQKDATGDYPKNEGILLYAGTKEGCTFKGWTTDSDDIKINGKSPATFNMPGHPVTVTAVWDGEPTPVTYPVTVTGAGEGSSGAGSYQAGQAVTVTAGTRPGYTFAGWIADGVTLASGTSSPTAAFTMPAGAVSLTACWTPEPVDGVTTLYLDELPGPVTINYEGYTCANEGGVRHTFHGKSYILTQRNPDTPTANTVTVASPYRTVQEFDITLKDVNIAGTGAAFSVGYPVQVNLTLEGVNTLKGGANHAGLELVSDTGYDQTTVIIRGQGSLTAAGGAGGAGIGGSLGDNFGRIEIAGGTVNAQGGAGAAGIGGGSCYANGGTGAGCANSTGNEVRITGGTVNAAAGATSGDLRGAAGIGTGEGVNTSQGGGPYVSVRISGGDTTAQGAGQAPAIGGTYIGNIRITGGTVTTRANPDCATEIGVHPDAAGTAGSLRQVRLADDSTGQGNAVVYVTGAGVIDNTPTSAYAGDNYDWNGIVYAGDAGQLYVSVNAKTSTVEWESLTVPAGKTLNIPQGVTVKLPEGAAVSGGQLRGDGWVQLGEVLHYIKADGSLAPCEVYYTGNNTPRVFNTLEELLTTWSAYLTTANNHIRLLTDVAYPRDLEFTHCTEAELDLNGHTLNLGTHQFNTALEQNPSLSPLLTICDSSAGKTGKITGDSAGALVYSPDGYLTITGGTFENTGAGPAVAFETTREESSLTGGTFSRIRISAAQGGDPAPLTGLLGSGLAFCDSAAEVWISPASQKAELSGVSVLAKDLPSLAAVSEDGSQQVSIAGLTGSASACQWLYSQEEGDPAAALDGAVGPVLYLNDGTLPGDGYVSCRVTVDGVTILTDPIFVRAEAPALLITVMAGASEIYDGRPHTPAVIVSARDGRPLQEGTDYVLSYENNTAAGQAFAVVTPPEGGSQYFSGAVRKGFTIAKAPLTIRAADQTVEQASAVQSGAAMALAEGLAQGDTLAGVTIAASGQQTVPSAAVIRNAAGEDVTGCYEITYRPGALTVTGGGSGDTPGTNPGGGSSSGGSSSGGGTRNPDGSVTTTRTDRNTGAVTETTHRPDGSVTTVVTERDGTVTTTETGGDGSRTTTVERPDGTSTVTVQTRDGTTARTEIDARGQSSSTVTVSRQAAAAAGDGAIPLPLPAVQACGGSAQASTVTVAVPGGATVRVPVSNLTAGTVAVLVRPDGTEEVVRQTLPSGDGIIFPVRDGDTVKIVDNARDFADVPADHWAASSVDFVSSRELFLGTSETAFSPGRAVTRGMLMTVLARLDGQDTSSGGGAWYAPGMSWAVARGISDGSAPEANISREQLVVMLYRYAGSPTPPNLLLDFTDADQVEGYAADAMRWAVSLGILQGKAGGLLDPKGAATRAQVARILENYLTVV